MKRYEDESWRERMSIRVELPAYLQNGSDPSAFPADALDRALPRIQRAHGAILAKWGRASKNMAWTKLPSGPKKTVEDVLRTAARIRKHYESFVLVGSGIADLGAFALHRALSHLHYNELPSTGRGGPRFYHSHSSDPESFQSLVDVIGLRTSCFAFCAPQGDDPSLVSRFSILCHSLQETVGDGWHRQVILVTSKGDSEILRQAKEYRCKIFLLPDGVSDAYGILTPMGLLPAAVCGIDIEELLCGAGAVIEKSRTADPLQDPALALAIGTYLSLRSGRNVECILPWGQSLCALADWSSQLLCASLGKAQSLRGKPVHIGQTSLVIDPASSSGSLQLLLEGPQDKTVLHLSPEEFRTRVDVPESAASLNAVLSCQEKAFQEALVSSHPQTHIILPSVNAYTVGQFVALRLVQSAFAAELLAVDAYTSPGTDTLRRRARTLIAAHNPEAQPALRS